MWLQLFLVFLLVFLKQIKGRALALILLALRKVEAVKVGAIRIIEGIDTVWTCMITRGKKISMRDIRSAARV